jgi:hypothetical protein
MFEGFHRLCDAFVILPIDQLSIVSGPNSGWELKSTQKQE